VLRVIMLNNNIKILLVSFVHHIELQNFLNAPRTLQNFWNELPRKRVARAFWYFRKRLLIFRCAWTRRTQRTFHFHTDIS